MSFSLIMLELPGLFIYICRRELSKSFIFWFLLNNFFLSQLIIHSLFYFSADLKVWAYLLRIIFDKIIFVPNLLWLDIGLFNIYILFILSLQSFFPLMVMYFYIIFNSLHKNLFVEMLFRFCFGSIRIML